MQRQKVAAVTKTFTISPFTLSLLNEILNCPQHSLVVLALFITLSLWSVNITKVYCKQAVLSSRSSKKFLNLWREKKERKN